MNDERSVSQAQADARVLAHAYVHDSKPPDDVVRRALAIEPVRVQTTPQQAPTMTRIDRERCPWCGADVSSSVELRVADATRHPLWRGEMPQVLRWLQCAMCEHVYTDGRWLSPESVGGAQVAPHRWAVERRFWAPFVEEMSHRVFLTRGSWLDVGAGSGALVATACEYGFSALGVDTRLEAVRAMREHGLSASAVLPETRHPIVTAMDVIEHVDDPRDFLRRLHEHVEVGGALAIGTPNLDSPMFPVIGEWYWQELEHQHLFGARQLAAAMEALGYIDVRYQAGRIYEATMVITGIRTA